MVMSSRVTWLLLLQLVLVAFLLVAGDEQHIQVANKQVTLDQVCSNRQVPIISVPEARRLINELKRNPSDCPQNYVQSFFELEPVLLLEPNERLCSARKFEQIKEYHFRYINPLVESYKLGDKLSELDRKIVKRPLDIAKVDYTVQLDGFKQEILIPISLQQFFKAWALQVSGECKRTLVENLDKATQLLTDTDFDIIEGLFEVDPLLKPVTGKVAEDNELNFDQLVYMPHLEGEHQPGDLERLGQTITLDLSTEPKLNKLMLACKRRFKPIYEKLVIPIVRLSKLGYEYVGHKLDDISEELEKGETVRRWLKLTKVCESQGNYDLIEPTDEDGAALFAMKSLEYEPMYNRRVDKELWVKGAEALARELNRIQGYHSTGLGKLWFNMGVAGRKLVARLDPHQFAWYRRNQNTLSSSLNMASIMSNTLSMTVG